jgi:hypothetical protein
MLTTVDQILCIAAWYSRQSIIFVSQCIGFTLDLKSVPIWTNKYDIWILMHPTGSEECQSALTVKQSLKKREIR